MSYAGKFPDFQYICTGRLYWPGHGRIKRHVGPVAPLLKNLKVLLGGREQMSAGRTPPALGSTKSFRADPDILPSSPKLENPVERDEKEASWRGITVPRCRGRLFPVGTYTM